MSKRVVCPVEYHIPVEYQDIFAIIRSMLSILDREQFEEIVQLMESMLNQEFLALRRSVKRNFRPFSCGAKGQPLMTRVGKGLPLKNDMDTRELSFVDDVIQLMVRARFHILDVHTYTLACGERFLFQLPVAPNWDYFDKKLLQRYWHSSTVRRRMRLLLPDEVADNCLVFHRGVKVMSDSGLYINEKIELLLQYTVVWLVAKVWGFVCASAARLAALARRLVLRRPAPPPKSPPRQQQQQQQQREQQQQQQQKRPAEGGAAGGAEEEPLDPHMHVVERRSLRLAMPTLWKLLLGFPKHIQIQEPAFREVIVMYRKKATLAKGSIKHVSVGGLRVQKKRDRAARLADILERRNIYIKMFHDIPIADLDAIFPDKKIWLKTLPIISMVVTAITALAALVSLFRSSGDFDLNVSLSTVSMVVARCYQVYSSAQAEKSDMVQEMTNILYDKTDDAQEGVLSMLLEDMAEQQLKEAVMAYLVLHTNVTSVGMTAQRIDEKCEEFLSTHFNIKIDFKIDDALERLLSWGLVDVKTTNKSKLYMAKPLDEMHELLLQRWQGLYRQLGRPSEQQEYPVTALFSDPNTVLPPLPSARARGDGSGSSGSGTDGEDDEDARQHGAFSRGAAATAAATARMVGGAADLATGALGDVTRGLGDITDAVNPLGHAQRHLGFGGNIIDDGRESTAGSVVDRDGAHGKQSKLKRFFGIGGKVGGKDGGRAGGRDGGDGAPGPGKKTVATKGLLKMVAQRQVPGVGAGSGGG